MDESFKRSVTHRIIKVLENNEIPWYRPWVGWCDNTGFPTNILSKKKFGSLNFILLQMAAKKRQFVSKWWGLPVDFNILNFKVNPRPSSVPQGEWGSEILLFQDYQGSKVATPALVYNADQCYRVSGPLYPSPKPKPNYDFAENVLQSTDANIDYNDTQKALYFYNEDYITIPKKCYFESGFGKLPAYYNTLAHELMHWTEKRVGYSVKHSEPEREFRAELGAAMLMEELHVPHTIINSNVDKFRYEWIKMFNNDYESLFRIAKATDKAVDYILSYSFDVMCRFNSESVA